MAFYPKNSKLLQFHSKLFEVDKYMYNNIESCIMNNGLET